MKEVGKDTHESYGMIDISRFSGGNGQFFASDLVQNGGISISISNASRKRDLSTDWIHPEEEIIRVELSHNQFVDAITSGMNTSGVPCTIKRVGNKSVPQINHVTDRKEQFSSEMKQTQEAYRNRIDGILELLDGNIGKKKASEIKHELSVLRNHLGDNDNFALECFNEAMDKTVTEAKHSISNYIDHKVHTFGIEAMRDQLKISIESDK